MSDRETQEFTTTNGHKIAVKTYLTVREVRKIEAIYLQSGKLNEFGKPEFSSLSGVVQQAEDEAIRQAVVSVDGKTENCLEDILNFKNKKDFDEIKAKLDEMIKGDKDDDKKKQ